MTEKNLRRTPLFDIHKSLGGRMVPFGDWEMPIQYEGVLAEHKTVRESCGIFDVSHMGEIFISGPQAKEFLQYITINDVNRLSPGHGQYTAMLNQEGGIVDDLIAYQLEDKLYLLCVNASNDDKDYQWVKSQQKNFDVTIKHESDKWGQIAIQGPKAPQCLEHILEGEVLEKARKLDYMEITAIKIADVEGYIARTGYTGELGFELYIPQEGAAKAFQSLLESAKPIGLGARDTLRLEACYLLYGNDMDDHTSPIEAGIGWATRMDCGPFIGKDLVEKHKEAGADRRQMIAFTLTDKGIPRAGMDLYHNDEKIGRVTSGGHLPTVGLSGGMALIKRGSLAIGDEFHVDIRGKRKLAKVAKKPLYSAKVK